MSSKVGTTSGSLFQTNLANATSIAADANGVFIVGSGGGGGIITINGDTGSITGSTVQIFSNQATLNSGSSVLFANSGTVSTLNVTDSFHNTIMGNGSGSLTNDTHNFNNTGFGMTVLTALDPTGVTGNQNTAFGYQALNVNVNGNNSCAFGMNSCVSVNDSNICAFGPFTLASATSGTDNCAFGNTGLGLLLTGRFNCAIGSNAGFNYAGAESSNICIMNAGVLGESNVMRLGTQGTSDGQINSTFIAGIAGVTTSNTEFVTIDTTTGEMGSSASAGSVTIDGDTGSATPSSGIINFHANNQAGSTCNFSATGNTVNLTLLSGVSNLCLGNNSTAITGARNIAVGDGALASLTTGSDNCAYGHQSLLNGSSTLQNTAYGTNSLQNLLTGIQNTCFGHTTGMNYTTSESKNILIGENVRGTVGESGIIRIGVTGDQTSCFIAGISGATITGAAVLCDTNGQLGTIVSSERFKENIQEIKSSKIIDLTPVSFTYKSPENPPSTYLEDKSTHFGMIAEDVHKHFPELVIYDEENKPFTIKYHEMYALLLAEIKSLRLEVNDLKNQAA